MPARRRTTATAITLAAGLTAFTAAALTGCDPVDTPVAASSASAPASASPQGGGKSPAGGSSPVPSTPPLNGTAGNGLTISDGSRWVVMNGTRVDFGTEVRDLAWSPDGSRAAFVDGDGDLVVARPDGGGRVVVARHTGSGTWSHPTWQVAPADTADGLPAKDNLIFTAGTGAAAVLETVRATAVGGTPARASLNGYGGQGNPVPPQTGNSWPNGGGPVGTSVYENADGNVYVRDDNLRQQGGVVGPGSEPALSPADDGSIVFVRSVAGHDHLVLSVSDGEGKRVVTDLTPGATTDYTEPAFARDGRSVAARTPRGIVTVPLHGGAPARVSGYPGLPAYRG